MAELNKNALTDEQKIAKEVIDKIFKELEDARVTRGELDRYDLKEIMKKINKEYKLIPQYDTLNDYLEEQASGSYHKFIFSIDGREMRCNGRWEFAKYYNPDLLDKYVVIKDEQKSNGGNCESYECVHKLTLMKKEELE